MDEVLLKGLWMLIKVLAQELHKFNISVNKLIPGPVITTKVIMRIEGKT